MRRRWPLVVGVLLLVIGLAVLGLYAWLHSQAGQAFVLRQVQSGVARAIEGRLELDRLELDGRHLVATNVKLFTPEGELVASVERVEFDVDLLALARNDFRLSHVELTGADVRLVRDERGLNFSRAIASRSTTTTSAPVSVRIDELRLGTSVVSYVDGDQRFELNGVTATGHATIGTEPLEVAGALSLQGTSTSGPVRGPVTLEATATAVSPGAVSVGLELGVATERLKATVEWPALTAEVTSLTVSQALLTELTGVAVPSQLELAGTLSTTAGTITARSGPAVLTATAAWNLSTPSVSSFTIALRGLDPSQWRADLPPSTLELDATGNASSLEVAALTGELSVQARWKTAAGSPLADADAQGTLKAGQATVKRLAVRSPGASLTLAGRVSATTARLEGSLELTDLARMERAVTELLETPATPLSGRGRMAIGLTGPWRTLTLTSTGSLTDLRVATFVANGADLTLEVHDLSRPLDADGTLTLRGLSVADRHLDELRANITTHGRALDVTLQTRGLGDLTLAASGVLDTDARGVALSRLIVETAEVQWALAAPTEIAWRRGFALTPTVLTAGDQRLGIEGSLTNSKVDGKVSTTHLLLERLPRVVAPASLGLTGVLDLQAAVSGSTSRPDVVATASLAGGAMLGITNVVASVDGQFTSGRVSGTVKGASSLGAIEGTVDVPLEALLDERADSMSLELTFEQLSLEALQRFRAETWPVVGTLSGTVSVKGPSNDPAVKLEVRSPALKFTRTETLERSIELKPVAVTITSDASGKLGLTAEGRAVGSTFSARLNTPFTVPALRRGIPTTEILRAARGALDVTITRVSLAELKTLGLKNLDDVTGEASVQLTVRGSVDDPTGLITLDFEHVQAPPLEDVTGRIELTASDTMTRLSGKGNAFGRPLFELEAIIDTPVRRLEQLDTLGPEHVTAHLSVAPMPLARLLPQRDDEVTPTGNVSLELNVKGTLDAPKVTLDSTTQGLSFGKVPLGQARLISKSQGSTQALSVTLKATANSELRVTGTVGVDLSIAALRRGFSPLTVPLALDVRANDFDLGFLSGVTPMVRTVGGALTLQNFRIEGPLRSPDVNGDVEWKRGRLGLASFGDYRDIDIEALLSRERISVGRLSVRAGGGALVLEPTQATRRATGSWALTGGASVKRFPLVTDDQLLAILSGQTSFEGDVSADGVDLTQLVVPRLDIELPELRRRDVQDLSRPGDLVIMRGGRVVAGKRTARPTTFTFRAAITAPRNLWLRSTDVNLEVGLSERFQVTFEDELQLLGTVSLKGGSVDVIGRRFSVRRSNTEVEVSQSSLRFDGPALQPNVNVTATHVNDREKVTVTVSLVGRGTDLPLRVSSDPPMSETEIYTLLATGRRDLRRSSGASITPEQAVSVVGSLAANQLKNSLLKRLPIDIVDVISIETGTEGLASTRVELGKYLGDRLYLGYVGQPGANKARGESVHTVRLEWQLSQDVSLEGTGGFDAPTFGADVVWSRDF